VCVLSLADTREQARQILARAALGGDPQGEKVEARKRRQGALSFGELGRRFLRDNEARLRPNRIAQDRPYMANRTFELVRCIFTWAWVKIWRRFAV
jgi:hypothetical protein